MPRCSSQSLLVLFPIYWMLITSLKLPREIYRTPSLWPQVFTFNNYRILLEDKGFLLNIRNSFIVATSVTVISVDHLVASRPIRWCGSGIASAGSSAA